MKNLACLLLAFVWLMSFATPALCEKDGYATGFVGLSIPNDSDLTSSSFSGVDASVSYDLGFALGIAGGHDFGLWRIEGELGYLKNDLNDINANVSAYGISARGDVNGDIRLLTLLLNGYFDIINNGKVTPYLTAGVGLASAEYSFGSLDEQDAVTAFQVGTGVSFVIYDETYIDIRYRYLMTSDIEIDNLDVEFSSHNILVGMTKRF